jgi:hypothetical protein
MLIPEEAAPQFRDNAAPDNGMIPSGVIRGLAGAAVDLIRSPLWKSQRSNRCSAHEIARRAASTCISIASRGGWGLVDTKTLWADTLYWLQEMRPRSPLSRSVMMVPRAERLARRRGKPKTVFTT